MQLEGKVAIITGASQGIGKAIAGTFAAEGAAVVISSRRLEEVQKVAAEIKKKGGKALGVKCDVRNRSEVHEMVRKALDAFKTVHILVNNAGISKFAPIVDLKEEDWDAVVGTDLKGEFNCLQAVLPHMMKQKYGKVINISSICGLGVSSPGTAAYGAAKAGIIQLTKVAAVEAGPFNINVNCIAPGVITTDLITQPLYGRATREELEKHLSSRKAASALGRLGAPEEIAATALFLVSEGAAYITGQTLACDGGRQSRM